MKRLSILLTATGLLLLISCEKGIVHNDAASSSSAPTALLRGGNNGGGGTTTNGLISSVSGVFKLIGGNSDSIQINLTQAAPAGCVLSLSSSSDRTLQVPSTFLIPQGTFFVHIPVTSRVITSNTSVTITATLNGQTKSSAPFDVFPLHATFPAPKLQSPGNGAGFKNRLLVKFTWVDNADAYYHDIQISDSPRFGVASIHEAYLDDPIWAASYFNGLGKRYWRVRYIDASGTPGPWSEAWNFEIK